MSALAERYERGWRGLDARILYVDCRVSRRKQVVTYERGFQNQQQSEVRTTQLSEARDLPWSYAQEIGPRNIVRGLQ